MGSDRMFFKSKEKKDAIKHYKRMIKWAKKQPPLEKQRGHKMLKEMGENWYSESCSYCKNYLIPPVPPGCWECVGNGIPKICCHGLWNKMRHASTWGDWITAAKKVLKYIKKNG